MRFHKSHFAKQGIFLSGEGLRPFFRDGSREEAAQKKEVERARKETEKSRIAQEKAAAKEAARPQRFWGGIAKSVLLPLARQALGSLFKHQ
ncbi:hypothetical protein NB640_03620 [Oxalobacter vibrioformis]|uniref:Uncharacterized protein n=1 Tax=Oxalobacter vibrioformis TaxID=933080 RepID=A0A9E9P3Z1_9BURK|nr:hypothetical protein [Oxalobacter vibrioformis]WAW10755.1 hypothetical protein NB640_03620 [Oxalobacter vibrioformis]